MLFQDMLFNTKKRCGEFYEKLVYRQRISRKLHETSDQVDTVAELSSEYDEKKLIDFFKSCLVPEQLDQLYAVLKESVEQRKLNLHGNKEILKSSIHLYMMCPQMVK